MFMFSENELQSRTWRMASIPTIYLYDGNNSLEEIDQNDAIVATYVHDKGIDHPLAQRRASNISYFDVDGVGSVTSLTDAAGTLVGGYAYDLFGNVSTSTGNVQSSFRYTSREFDVETGLNYYRARYYDPATGRFLSEDPIRWIGGRGSFYPYVHNNPGLLSDPSGLYPNLTPEPQGGPPMPVPGQPNLGWRWNPNPGNDRGGTYRPEGWQGPNRPEVNWDPNDGGHWDLKPGDGSPTERYDRWGNPITPEQAHRRPGPKCPANTEPAPQQTQISLPKGPSPTTVGEVGTFALGVAIIISFFLGDWN
jgi:RHS repeat-associated protein